MCVLVGRDELEDLFLKRGLMMKKLENHWPSYLGSFLACCKSHIKHGVVSPQPSRQGKINGFALWVLFCFPISMSDSL